MLARRGTGIARSLPGQRLGPFVKGLQMADPLGQLEQQCHQSGQPDCKRAGLFYNQPARIAVASIGLAGL